MTDHQVTLDPGFDDRFTTVNVMHAGTKVASLNIQHRERKGQRIGTVNEARRVSDHGPGSVSIAYGLLVEQAHYEVLRSDNEMSAEAVQMWERLVPPPKVLKFRCRNIKGEQMLVGYEAPTDGRIPTPPQRYFWCLAASELAVRMAFPELAPDEIEIMTK